MRPLILLSNDDGVGSPWLGGTSKDDNRYFGAVDPRRNMGLALGY